MYCERKGEHKGTIKQRSEVYETSQEWIQKEQLFHTMSMLGGFVIFLLLCAKRKGCISIKKHRTKESRGGKRMETNTFCYVIAFFFFYYGSYRFCEK